MLNKKIVLKDKNQSSDMNDPKKSQKVKAILLINKFAPDEK